MFQYTVWHKFIAAAVKVIVTIRSVSIWLCVQGQLAELNLYGVWDTMYWNGAFWDSVS